MQEEREAGGSLHFLPKPGGRPRSWEALILNVAHVKIGFPIVRGEFCYDAKLVKRGESLELLGDFEGFNETFMHGQ